MSSQAAAATPGFGTAFTPHMLVQDYKKGAWGPAEIVPYAPFTLEPSAVVFHYGQEIFEGFKVYKQPDGSLALFRPDANLARLTNSAKRLSMAPIDEKQVLADILALVRADAAQAPARPNSIYVRPTMIATDTVIKVNPSSQYRFFVVMCVVGDYFAGNDPRGVRIRTETEFVRAAPGGTGAAKCGGNYAASLSAQGQASKEGFDQVIWLDARDRTYIEEMGGMNIMFVIDGKLVTPPAPWNGSILPGVTRDSLLKLAKAQGIGTEERPISTDELATAFSAGKLQEAFACGTAAVVTPIREIVHRGEVLFQNRSASPGSMTMKLRQQLMDIQFGLAPDSFGWRLPVR